MRKLSFVAVCVTGMVCAGFATASARTPIHFIYAKSAVSFEQFQGDTGHCHHIAATARYQPNGYGGQYVHDGSSTRFLNCMADKGYVLAKNGWDTGVLWVLPGRPVDWHGPGWHIVEPGGFITSGPFPDKVACQNFVPSGSHALNCVWLEHAPH